MSCCQVKPREYGRGPYRWSHVVKNPKDGGLRQGSIYRSMGDEFTPKMPPNCASFATRTALNCARWLRCLPKNLIVSYALVIALAVRLEHLRLLSYDVPMEATPPSQKVPNFEAGNFTPISRDYRNNEPVHLHIFDPPRHPIPPVERKIGEGPESRAFLDYPMASFAYSVTLMGLIYGYVTFPFKSLWTYIRMKYAMWSLMRAARSNRE